MLYHVTRDYIMCTIPCYGILIYYASLYMIPFRRKTCTEAAPIAAVPRHNLCLGALQHAL